LIFQSHLNLFLRAARRILGHEEFNQHGLSYYQALLRKYGYSHQRVLFRDVIAFPLSGGYLTPQLFSHIGRLEDGLLLCDRAFNDFLRTCHCQRLFCWRFLLIASRETVPASCVGLLPALPNSSTNKG
jgi:hypothetical protein